MLFSGEYYYHLDAKNRLVVPGKIRERINVQIEGSGWHLVPGFDGTISMFTPARFEELAARQKAELFRLKDVRSYDRLHFGLSAQVEMDRLGRILVPEIMLRRAGIDKDLAIIGVRDHLEIWAKDRWDEFVRTNYAQYDDMASKAYETERNDARELPG